MNFFDMKWNIYYKLTVLSWVLLLSISCEKSSSENPNENKASETEELKSQSLDFPNQPIFLSPEAKEAVEDWELYQAMETEIERMESFKLEDLIVNSSVIYKAADTLQKTLPQKLRNRPVSARLKVLHSKTAQLKQLAERQQPDFHEMKKVANEVPIDFYNLNIQLNELFLEFPPMEQ